MAASELSGSRSTTIGKPMNAAFGKLDSRANTELSSQRLRSRLEKTTYANR